MVSEFSCRANGGQDASPSKARCTIPESILNRRCGSERALTASCGTRGGKCDQPEASGLLLARKTITEAQHLYLLTREAVPKRRKRRSRIQRAEEAFSYF